LRVNWIMKPLKQVAVDLCIPRRDYETERFRRISTTFQAVACGGFGGVTPALVRRRYHVRR